MKITFFILFLTTVVFAVDRSEQIRNVRQTLNRLVEAKPIDNESAVVKIGVERLKKAGIPFEITEFLPGRQNLVARLKGNGTKKPVMILAHTDVVPAWGQNWTTEPHKVTEVDGFLIGRGVADDLGYAAVGLEILIMLKESGVKLNRDIILAWTGAEETGGDGVKYLLEKYPEQVDAEIVLNEGGNVILDEATKKPKFIGVEASQKIIQNFELVSKGDSGHSSRPYGKNAIYEMAKTLTRLEKHNFPVRLNPITRAYLKSRAALESKDLGKAMIAIAEKKGNIPPALLRKLENNPELMSTLRTTCVPTLIKGGLTSNALPTSSKVTINCRILPDETIEDVHKKLKEIIQNPEVEIVLERGRGPSKPSPIDGDFMRALKLVNERVLNNIPIITSQASGATDSCFFRNRGVAAYGLSPIFRYEADGRRSHGADERIPITGLEQGFEFFHQLVLELATQK